MTERTPRPEIPAQKRSVLRRGIFIFFLIGVSCLVFWYFLHREQQALEEHQRAKIQEWENRRNKQWQKQRDSMVPG